MRSCARHHRYSLCLGILIRRQVGQREQTSPLAPSGHDRREGRNQYRLLLPQGALHGWYMRAPTDAAPWEWQDTAGTSQIRRLDRKSTRLNSSHVSISYAVFCLKQKTHALAALTALTDSTPDAALVCLEL